MKEFKNFTEFRLNMNLVPEIVALDAMVRINDWVSSGGSLEDRYVKQILTFVSQFINYKGEQIMLLKRYEVETYTFAEYRNLVTMENLNKFVFPSQETITNN